ncbi:MAG: C25 family peptidase propeptide domain-containing protein [Ardenticatenia bacterium]|nr:C25 family peptidase propeptide domain-containing protein [Ardenticatenia bacterium]
MRTVRYFLLAAGISVAFLFIGLLPGYLAHGAEPSSSQPITWQQVTSNRLLITFSAPEYRLERQEDYDQLMVPGFEHASEPGTPQLPSKSILVAVPPEGTIGVRIVQSRWQALPGTYRLPLAPRPAPLEADLVPGSWEPIPAITLPEGFYPSIPVEVSPPAWIRGQRVVRVTFFPFQYEPTTGLLRRNTATQVEITFSPTATLTPIPPSPDDPFDVALRQSVVNSDMVKAWRVPPDQAPLSAATTWRTSTSQVSITLKIVVDRDGLYRLTYTDLVAAGLDPSTVDPRTFAMTNQGVPVAIRVVGEEDGSFDPNDVIEFYGQRFRGELMARRYAALRDTWLSECGACELKGLFAKYTDENVYWLSAGGTPGPRMATVDGTPDSAPVPRTYRTTVRAEEANHWWTHHFGSEDTWFWDRIQPSYDPSLGTFRAVTRTYTITLTGVVTTGTPPAQLRAEIGSRTTSPGHRTRFFFNDTIFTQPVYSETWDGRGLHAITATLPVTRLREGQNALTFVLGENTFAEDMYFNWFEVEYDRLSSPRAESSRSPIPLPARGGMKSVASHRLTWQSTTLPILSPRPR